jgi:hypothetical protein
MSSAGLGLIIELLVAVLLVMTIGYCMVLNKRLKALRADEHLLKATIGELLSATEVAERAIIGLKATTREAEAALGQKLRDAQTFRSEFQQHASSPKRQAQPVQTPCPQPQTQRSPAQAAPTLQTPTPQQVTTAMRGLEHELSHAPVDPAPQTPRDFRMFTRTSFSSRNG